MIPQFLSVLGIAATVLGAPIVPAVDQVELGPSELRIVELAPGVRHKVTFEELLALKREGTNFIDVTDHLDDYDRVTAKTVSYDYPKHMAFSDEINDKYFPELSKQHLIDNLTEFSGFYTRYAKSDTGLESSLWLYNAVLEIVANRPEVNVSLYDHSWQQKSVIARFKGTKRPDEVVIVGAHQDSINLLMPTLLPAPGADDDGSGSMTILEAFRVLVGSGWQPENTVEFQWYSAEELGLLGSQDIASDYSAKGVNVVAMLEQDMTGYSAGSTRDGGPDLLGVFTDNADPGLTNFVKRIVDNYCTIGYVETQCGYSCSDYASWTYIAHAPAAFVSESSFDVFNPFIHTTEDKVDKLDFDHMIEHARLTLAFAVELGGAKLKQIGEE